MTGLLFPQDLDAWHRWQLRQRGVKARVKGVLDKAKGGATSVRLTATHHRPAVVVAMDAVTPTVLAALLKPLQHMSGPTIGILSHVGLADLLETHGLAARSRDDEAGPTPWRERVIDLDEVAGVAVGAAACLALGDYLAIGAAVNKGSRPGRFLTVQHGLLTPHAPPLASGTRLLAWSQADAEFWRSGRDDVATTVAGSQLLWDAAKNPAAQPNNPAAQPNNPPAQPNNPPAQPNNPAAPRNNQAAAPPASTARPVYLGQLHGAELDRAALAASTERFCRDNGAIYRPHPSERDRRSRAQHKKWAAQGIEIDEGSTPLAEMSAPIASAFSTGILEAAAKGMPAWAYHADPPAWLREFWTRYGMHQWGDTPTPPPEQPMQEPAQAIAHVVREMVEDS